MCPETGRNFSGSVQAPDQWQEAWRLQAAGRSPAGWFSTLPAAQGGKSCPSHRDSSTLPELLCTWGGRSTTAAGHTGARLVQAAGNTVSPVLLSTPPLEGAGFCIGRAHGHRAVLASGRQVTGSVVVTKQVLRILMASGLWAACPWPLPGGHWADQYEEGRQGWPRPSSPRQAHCPLCGRTKEHLDLLGMAQ